MKKQKHERRIHQAESFVPLTSTQDSPRVLANGVLCNKRLGISRRQCDSSSPQACLFSRDVFTWPSEKYLLVK